MSVTNKQADFSSDYFIASPLAAFRYALKPYKVRLVFYCLFVIIGNIFVYSIPYFLKLITDKAVDAGGVALTLQDFLPLLLLTIVSFVSQEAFFRSAQLIEISFTVSAFDRITTRLFQFILDRPLAYFEEKFSGELTRRVEQVGSVVKSYIEGMVWEFAWPTMASIMTAILLFSSHWWLGFVFVVWLVLFLGSSYFLIKAQYIRAQDLAEKSADVSGTVVDTFSNISLVHAFAAHEHEYNHYRLFMDKAVAADQRERVIEFMNRFQQGASLVILSVALVFTGVILFTKNAITIGDFVIVAATIPTFIGIVFSIGEMAVRSIRQYGEIKNALESLQSSVPLVHGGPSEIDLQVAKAIEFKNVSFSYNSTGRGVLEDFSLRIEPGQKVGLVGKSGAGKSTVVKLLLRSYDPQSGQIEVNGTNISDLKIKSWRDNIAFVPQDTTLFNRTLYENIIYAKPSASRDELITASKKAHADDFIAQYPKSYDTLVGERGVKLSGGQRQRIALARAILKAAPILVLDEATSALDSESEEVIQKGLQDLFEKRTVVAIAHRLSTLRAMDRIIVLDHGKIVEDGAPQDLLAKENSLFKAMWEHQKKGFI